MTNINDVTCVVDECERLATRRKLVMCERHYKQDWRNRNPDSRIKARTYAKNRRKEARVSNEESYLQDVRARNLWVNYKMTVEEYELILSRQDFKCAICECNQSDVNKRFSVDNDHSCCEGRTSCGKCVRALLCSICNRGLGAFQESSEVLRKAAEYLDYYSMKVDEFS